MANEEPFSRGTLVTVTFLHTPGEVIDGPNRKGEYLVALGTVNSWVPREKLLLLPPKKGKKTSKKWRATSQSHSKNNVKISVDLHGLTRDEAVIRVEQAIDQALLTSNHRLEIIHGLGSGILQKAIHHYLSQARQVSRFELDKNNPGTTWVWL